MSKRASPVAIGLFMIGALILLVIGVVVFGSAGWFDDRSKFVSYFRESVNGLEKGAEVKFQGVPVGRVTDLQIRIDMGDESFQVPVVYEIDLSQVQSEGGSVVHLDEPDVLQSQIEEGLRAQLQIESFVTGQLYVELTFDEDSPVFQVTDQAPYPVIPSKGSFLSTLGDEASDLMEGVEDIDIGALNENIMRLLVTANRKLSQFDAAGINQSLLETSAAIRNLADSPDIRRAVREIPGMTEQFNRTMVEVQDVVGRFGVVADSLEPQLAGTNEELVLTLQAMRDAATETQGIFSSNYGIGYRMEEALESLSEAAEALELLVSELERNPSMLLRGKGSEEE